MSNFIIALAVFVITIVGALFTVPYFIDWNGYRGVFEEEATRLLGREVRVGGAVNLHVLPTPYFRFEKVRIADTSVNLQEPFFRADSLTIKLTVAPLFRGAIEANEVEFQRPVLRLAADAADGWNWQSFGAVLAGATYLPTNVALTSVRISNGVLAVHGPDGIERTRFEGIDAELSAPALRGPYRLRGTFSGLSAREIKIATAEPEADGAVRFKAMLSAGTATSYTLDGRLLDPMGKPRLVGELSARLPTADLFGVARALSAEGERAERGGPAFELRASLAADAAGADLSDLALSFEQDGRPQLISGTLKAAWRDSLRVDMNLASRWLDLDRIAGAGEGADPLASIIPLALRLRDLLPADTRSHARFSIDQANLGREAVSGLGLELGRSGDKLEVERLRLSMPGGSRGELKGVVSGPPDRLQFEGSVGLRGASMVRFVTWATGSALPFVATGDGSFSFRSRIAVASGSASARDVVGDLSGTAFGGEAEYRWQGRRELSLSLEGPQLDARAFVPAGSTLGDVFNLAVLGTTARGSAQAAAGEARWRAGDVDASVRFNAGQLITADRTYRDVAAQVELKEGRLKLPLLRIAGDDGFSIELEGELEDAALHPKGTVRGAIGVETAQGLAAVLALFGIDKTVPLNGRARAVVPLRVAGAMRFGRRTPESADLSLEGEANGASVRINGRFDGSAAGWRAAPADITALMESTDAGPIAELLLSERTGAGAGGQAPGRLLIKAHGVPAEGMSAIASVDAGNVAVGFSGRIFAADSDTTANGELEIKAADAARVAGLAGIAASLRWNGRAVEGSLNLSASRSGVRIDRLALRVGGAEVRGKLLLSPLGERPHVEAQFDLDELTLAQLLAPLLDPRLAVATAAETAISGHESLWPDEGFDSAAFDALEGNIHLTGKHLALTDGVGLRQVSLDIALGAGTLDVKKFEGLGLGGRVQASVRCEKAPGGIDVRGSLSLRDGRLETIAADSGAKGGAVGGIAGEITFAGRGGSARNVISALQGAGRLTFSEAKLATLWPGAIAMAAQAALQAEPDKVGASLRQGLLAGLAAGQLPLPDRVALDVADGQLRMKPLVIETPQGRASGAASLDLKSLILESDWRLEEVAAKGDRPAPPAITIGYRAPVIALGSHEPQIATEALEREIAVRRVERDIEELERLRKLDDTRRREDADRVRRQLDQQAPPVPVAPAAPQGRSARPG
jgi:uncharacterized protein involved in outer membrane biogenesis